MKKIFLLLFLLPAMVFSQVKKDNTIIAHNVSFDSAVNRLLDLGYLMKKILLLTVLIPTLVFSQQKGDNTIIIKGISMEKAINIFRDHGYMIGAAVNSVVSTMPKKSANGIFIAIEIDIKDSIGYMKGTYDRKPIYNGLWDHSESYAGHYKGGSFQMMDSLAKSFGQPVSYAKL